MKKVEIPIANRSTRETRIALRPNDSRKNGTEIERDMKIKDRIDFVTERRMSSVLTNKRG